MRLEFGVIIGIVSAVTAIISVLFAYVAVKMSRKNNLASLVSEVHIYYRSEIIYHATQTAWGFYKWACFEEKDYVRFLSNYPGTEKIIKPFVVRNLGDDSIYVDISGFDENLKAKLEKIKKAKPERDDENKHERNSYSYLNWVIASNIKGGNPISPRRAQYIKNNIDRGSSEWQGLHNASAYWRYIALLVFQGLLSEDIAWNFTSPDILGFIYVFEDQFLDTNKPSTSELINNPKKFSDREIYIKRPLYWLHRKYKHWRKKNKLDK